MRIFLPLLLFSAAPALAQDGPVLLSVGAPVNGELTSTDLQAADSTYYDLYRFSGEAGQTVVLTMTSTAFDTQMSLHRGGATVASDDNGGGGTNAKIAFTLPAAGEYEIRASAADGGLGPYVIRLEAGAGR